MHLPDQHGIYRVTLREHDDAIQKLNWTPIDQLSDYIQTLTYTNDL